MLRPLSSILAALQIAFPTWRMPETRENVAIVIQKLAEKNGHDPLTLIVVVAHESGGDPSIVNRTADGNEYIGLGQHRLANYQGCRPGEGREASEICRSVRTQLSDWRFNLEETSRSFVVWQNYCFEAVHTRAAVYWLSGYGGWDAKYRTICGHRGRKAVQVPREVLKILKRRRELERKVSK